MTTRQYARLVSEWIASIGNYGSWSVNEGDKTLTLTFEVALVPNNEGTEVKATASVTGDELKLTVANVNGYKLDLVYRRAR
jgi:hypothetical protein